MFATDVIVGSGRQRQGLEQETNGGTHMGEKRGNLWQRHAVVEYGVAVRATARSF